MGVTVQKNSKWWVLGVGSTCFMMLVANAVYRFKNQTIAIYNEYKLTELKEAAEHQVEYVQRDFQSKINLLNALAEKAMKLNNITLENILEDLQFVALSDDFNYVGICDI